MLVNAIDMLFDIMYPNVSASAAAAAPSTLLTGHINQRIFMRHAVHSLVALSVY